MKIDSLVYWCLGILLLLALGFLYYRYSNKVDCEDARFYTKADSYAVNAVIEFGDNTPGAHSWEWDFGDGEYDYRQQAFHSYKEAGDYIVRLRINDYCINEKVISIGDLINNPESMPRIISPNVATIGETIQFQGDRAGGKSWEWNFGESGQLDALTQNPTYTYRTQGRKKVTLIVNGDIQSIATKYIYIAPKDLPVDRSYDITAYNIEKEDKEFYLPPGDVQRDPVLEQVGVLPVRPMGAADNNIVVNDEVEMVDINKVKVMQIIKQIADESKTSDDLMPYACSDDIYMAVKGQNNLQSLEQFSNKIAGKNMRIESLKINRDKKTNCIKSMEIDYQVKRYGIAWTRDN